MVGVTEILSKDSENEAIKSNKVALSCVINLPRREIESDVSKGYWDEDSVEKSFST